MPLAVVYDFTGGQIKAARVYFAIPAFLAQVATTEARDGMTGADAR